MNNKNRIQIYLFIVIGFALILTNSCEKDEKSSKKDPVITWTNPADIISGTALSATQLNATANVEGTFIYTPGIGTVLSAGDAQNLIVDFTPTDDVNYNTATKTVLINVIPKKDPIITWDNPVDITLPTALSTIQLNATANIPGTFTYTPSIGTVLSIGAAQNLKVDFTPTDAVNYNVATKTVIINVKGSGTVTDYDGNVYNTVVIGTQTWMVENLKVTHYRNGAAIANVIDNTAWTVLNTGAYCWYSNNVSNKGTYGALYNWFTVADSRNIAPTGWHIPTDAEWTTMENYLIANGYNYDGSTTGYNYAKALASATGWDSDAGTGTVGNTDYPAKRNATGFTALPGGRRSSNGTFYLVGGSGDWWSATEGGATYAFGRYLGCDISNVSRSWASKEIGFSVRCLRD